MFVQSKNFGVNNKLQFNVQINSYNYPIHIHQFAELCYCISGEQKVIINGDTLTLSAGDFVFVSPLSVHGYQTPKYSDLIVMAFSTTLIPEFPQKCEYLRNPRKFDALYFKYVFMEGGLVAESFEESTTDYEGTKSFYIDLGRFENLMRFKGAIYSLLAECNSFVSCRDVDTDSLSKLLIWLGEHFTEEIDLSDAASALGYSKNYLSHKIKSLSGLSFPELLTNLRIDRARELLKKGETVLDAALDSGFGSERNFYRVFKNHTSMTPREYSKLYR